MSPAALARRRAARARAVVEATVRREAITRTTRVQMRRRRLLGEAVFWLLAFVATGWVFQDGGASTVWSAEGGCRAVAGLVAALVFDRARGYHGAAIIGLACLADSAATGAWLATRTYDTFWIRDSAIRWLVLAALAGAMARIRRSDQAEGI